MAAFTVTQSGNINDGATFGNTSPGVEGTDFPTLSGGDSITDILSGYTLTLNVDYVSNSDIILGDASTSGSLVFNAGTTISGTGRILHNRGTLSTTATAINPSYVKCEIASGAVSAGSRMQLINLDYISFQDKAFTFQNLFNGSSLDIQNCSFVNCGVITFGLNNWTMVGDKYHVKNNDFIDTGHVYFYGRADHSNIDLSGNTFSQSVATKNVTYQLGDTGNTNLIAGSIYNNYYFQNNTSRETQFQKIISINTLNGNGDGIGLVVGNTDFKDNFVYTNYVNPHPVSFQGTGTSNVSGNVFQIEGTEPNTLMLESNTEDVNIFYNIQIGNSPCLANSVGSWSNDVYEYNNTVWVTTASAAIHNGLWLTENGTRTGITEIYNNICGSPTLKELPQAAISKNATPEDAAFDFVGYNDLYQYPEFLNVSATTGGGTSLTDNPNFVDSSRNFSSWGISVGTDGSEAATIQYVLDSSGYNSTTKAQTDTPYIVLASDIISYFQAGFTPQNSALQDTGRTGEDIGAVAVSATIKKIYLTLVNRNSIAQADLTGLNWAFFDEVTPNILNAPVDQGTGETTDGTGILEIQLTNTTLDIGETGFLVVSDSDGTASQSPPSKAFAAPVVVSE